MTTMDGAPEAAEGESAADRVAATRAGVPEGADARRRQALSFAAAAAAYTRGRPGYPVEAIAWLVGDARRVLDLGAGTGKLTAALVALDRDVIAVDPIEEMLDELEIAVPGVPRILGTAEEIPLEDGSVDAVVVGQAWHWFERERAVPEIARVLRPGGVLGLVWNSRDTDVPWMARAGELMHERHDANADLDAYVQLPAPFGRVESHTLRWTMRMTKPAFLDLVRSRSYFITAPPEDQHATIAALERLLAEDPALAPADEIEVPYLTRGFRSRLAR